MSRSSMITKQVSMAFKTLGNLAENLKLTLKNTGEFDFENNSAIPSTAAVKIVKGIRTEAKRDGVTGVSFLVQTKELPTVEPYDTIEDGKGVVWKIVEPSASDGFITTVKVTGGVNG